jgi:hypothetical protein
MSEIFDEVNTKTGGLYSRKEIEKELVMVKGIKPFYGTNSAFCKLEA